MKHGKVWGETRALLQTPFCEVHEIRVKAKGRCSVHRHEFKSNAFYCVSGHMRIAVEKTDYALTDKTELTAGDFTTVKPGEFHHFEALTDCVVLEIYYPQPLGEDIVRRICGSCG